MSWLRIWPLCLAAALGCVDTGVIALSSASLEGAPLAAPEPALEDAGLPTRSGDQPRPGWPSPCREDCGVRGKVCDELLHECVACRRGDCEHPPGCDPQWEDCLRCRDDFDCPASIPLCFDHECHRCAAGRERDPQCNPRAGGSRDRDDHDARAAGSGAGPSAGAGAGSSGM